MNDQTVRVLIIDDDEDDYILTRELFSMVKTGNYSLDWASSYEEGLRIAALREHDVCLVDYRLGKHDGIELIQAARISRLTTPMILLTGAGDYDIDVKAMNAGATDYLVKDETSPSRLERTIRYSVQLNVERCRAEELLQAHAKKQAAVAELGRRALTGGDLAKLFEEAVGLVTAALNTEYCEALELLPDGSNFVARASLGWKDNHPGGRQSVPAVKLKLVSPCFLTSRWSSKISAPRPDFTASD
jgi:FixJ family two-component response regulator